MHEQKTPEVGGRIMVIPFEGFYNSHADIVIHEIAERLFERSYEYTYEKEDA